MKKFNFFSNLAILLIAVFSITSCSKNDEVDESENDAISSFAKSFYRQNISYGESAETKLKWPTSSLARTEEYGDVKITEIFVGNEERARGYAITSKDTDVLLYFVDVDRVEFKMTTIDIETDQVKIAGGINELEKYAITNQFDFIKIAQDLNTDLNPGNVTNGWHYSYGSCRDGRRGVYRAYFLFGFQWTNWTAVQEPNSSGTGYTNATVACDEKYSLDNSID